MTTDISNSDNVVDSRDILERIAELEEEMEEYQEKHKLPSFDWTGDWQGSEYDEWDKKHRKHKMDWVIEEWHEWVNENDYIQLKKVEEQADGYGDWKYGEALIRDSYFEEYAQELAEDVCEMPRDLCWPYTCIDWEQAANELKQDYTEIDWDGVVYWMRS